MSYVVHVTRPGVDMGTFRGATAIDEAVTFARGACRHTYAPRGDTIRIHVNTDQPDPRAPDINVTVGDIVVFAHPDRAGTLQVNVEPPDHPALRRYAANE